MTQIETILNRIVKEKVIGKAGEKDYFDWWSEFALDKYQELQGVQIPYHLDEWEDIYGIQYTSLLDAMDSVLRCSMSNSRHNFHAQKYLDEEFDPFKESPELPENLKRVLETDAQMMKQNFLSLHEKDAMNHIAYIDVFWTLWKCVLEDTLSELSKLNAEEKKIMKSVSADDFHVFVYDATHEPAKRMITQYLMKKKAA